MNNQHSIQSRNQIARDRKGSTLLIVVALLGMLAFLGFMFYTFAKQERANAVTYSKGAQVLKAPSIEPDALFDFALQQIILGPPDAYVQSILWGGRHSLLANMFGRDGIPWNGEGVNLIQTAIGQPQVDMNYDGVSNPAVDNANLFDVVDSPAANANAWTPGAGAYWESSVKRFRGSSNIVTQFDIPEPDVNYNAPDINSLFLSYDGVAVGLRGANPTRVIIPSFVRPQYLRNGGSSIPQWYNSAFVPANHVMRPHPNHVCVDPFTGYVININIGGTATPVPRFTSANDPASINYKSLNLRRPFTSAAFAPEPINGQPQPNGFLGVWSASNTNSPNVINANTPRMINGAWQYETDLDVDTDGDGVPDAILMDLGYPPIRRGDGKLVVPLFAISIRDLNGLLNVNATGNLAGNINIASLASQNQAALSNSLPATDQLGARPVNSTTAGGATIYIYTPDNLSKSNLGLTPNEINIQRAFTADPNNDSQLRSSEAAQQLSYFLQLLDPSINSVTQVTPGRTIAELANLEWLFLNVGRPSFHLGLAQSASPLTNAITGIFSGRNGEAVQSLSTTMPATPAQSNSVPVTNFNSAPIAVYSPGTATTHLAPYRASGQDQPPPALTRFLVTGNALDLPKPGISTAWNGNPPIPITAPISVPANSTLINSNDDIIAQEGEPTTSATSQLRWVTPLDFRGSGQQFHHFNWGLDGQPGFAGVDDDGNGVYDDFSEEGWPGSDDTAAVYGKQPVLVNLKNSILFFPAYSGYHSFFSQSNPLWGQPSGGVRWGDQLTTPNYFMTIPTGSGNPPTSLLMRGSVWNSLFDDPSEMILDPTVMSPAYLNYLNYLVNNSGGNFQSTWVNGLTSALANDSVFGAEEMLFLQGSASDQRLSESRSRLAELAPASLVASTNAADIRKRLTTVSADRREFGSGSSIVGGYNVANPNQPLLRSWESYPPSTNNQFLFPPCRYTASPFSPSVDPYRPELYHYLAGTLASTASQSLKLDVNRWLYLDGNTGQYAFSKLPEQTSPGDLTATTVRQNMARDIYTLLYTFCFVHTDGISYDLDYRSVLAANVPTAAQAKEMAQFAVNLVDALDSDNIITAFYYDPNLSDAGGGWTATQGNPNDPVVFGVERQLLAFSEVVALQVKKTSLKDSDMTIFDDTIAPAGGASARPYLFFELQNVSPMDVTLASSNVTKANAATNADWRVRLTDPTGANEYNVLYFLPGLDQANNYVQKQNNDAIISSGSLFTVASQDGTDKLADGNYRTSDFRADGFDGNRIDGVFERIVPKVGVAGTDDTTGGRLAPTKNTPFAQFPTPKCNLDLVWNYGDGAASPSRFSLKNNDGSPGGFVWQLGDKPNVRLILERRAAAGGVAGTVWTAVDQTSFNNANGITQDVLIGTVNPPIPPPDPITAALVQAQLKLFNAYPRTLPLLRNTIPTTPPLGTANTINSPSTVQMTNATNPNSIPWQLHNDREFGSLSELMQLPLYGPDQLTNALAEVIDPGTAAKFPSVSTGQFYRSTINLDGTTNATRNVYYPSIAAGRFLRPDNPDYVQNTTNVVPGAPNPNNGNRWYRLLNFLEVPNRSHQHSAIAGVLPVGIPTINPAAGIADHQIFFNAPSVAGLPGSTSYSATTSAFAGAFNLPLYFGWPRTHGLVNLNMIRHPQVLSALIDDDQAINDPRLVATLSQYLDDASGEANRQWWVEFLQSRDSRFIAGAQFPVDPVVNNFLPVPYAGGVGGLFLPGTANARPFRGLDSVGPLANNPGALVQDSPLENTILRSLPIDSTVNNNNDGGPPNESRRLFEIGSNVAGASAEEHFGKITDENSNNPLHPSARYRLMSKLMNNTTTRSNSFAVYVTVQYYEAAQVTSGNATATRIGGRLDDAPAHRGFFVVDRTAAIDQMKVLSANGINPVSPISYSFQANTDNSGNRNNQNGIRWKDLVLYRQTLN